MRIHDIAGRLLWSVSCKGTAKRLENSGRYSFWASQAKCVTFCTFKTKDRVIKGFFSVHKYNRNKAKTYMESRKVFKWGCHSRACYILHFQKEENNINWHFCIHNVNRKSKIAKSSEKRDDRECIVRCSNNPAPATRKTITIKCEEDFEVWPTNQSALHRPNKEERPPHTCKKNPINK